MAIFWLIVGTMPAIVANLQIVAVYDVTNIQLKKSAAWGIYITQMLLVACEGVNSYRELHPKRMPDRQKADRDLKKAATVPIRG